MSPVQVQERDLLLFYCVSMPGPKGELCLLRCVCVVKFACLCVCVSYTVRELTSAFGQGGAEEVRQHLFLTLPLFPCPYTCSSTGLSAWRLGWPMQGRSILRGRRVQGVVHCVCEQFCSHRENNNSYCACYWNETEQRQSDLNQPSDCQAVVYVVVMDTSHWAHIVCVSQLLVSGCTFKYWDMQDWVALLHWRCSELRLRVWLQWTGLGQLAARICYTFPRLDRGTPWCYISVCLFGCGAMRREQGHRGGVY